MSGTYKQFTGTAIVANLSAGITGTPTTFSVSSATGFPTGSGGVPFCVTVDRGKATEERILCSAQASGIFTIQTRGFDGTAQVDHANGATVEHTIDADSMNDSQQHIHLTSRDDHTQYAKTDGTRAFSGGVTVTTGGLTVTAGGLTVVAGGLTVSAGTTAVQALTATSVASSGAVQAATSGTAGRYIGVLNGAPTSGTYNTNDFGNDPTNATFWICTSGGTPGTWKALPSGHVSARVYMNNSFSMTNAAIVKFDTVDWDSVSMYSATTGKFTVPLAGIYRINSSVQSTNGASNSIGQISIQKNAAVHSQGALFTAEVGISRNGNVDSLVNCAANDTLSILWDGTTGDSCQLGTASYVCVQFMGSV